MKIFCDGDKNNFNIGNWIGFDYDITQHMLGQLIHNAISKFRFKGA